ncbi:MAG TPA: flavin reductase [Candidatus Anaerostipes excrementavium]|uniref:Flavin reductase n=1 Tax=Candidatus Anaerostipes excrementavium TaxID=2838463 RepID=A0A9D2B8A1_9FIRM|nr:flavin reductase [uncultured Anaerostipes sp.]HIX66716.1 flavin reductase [Candidatus Anaerostipes excrementavium]
MKNQAAMFKLTYGLFVLSAKEGEKDNGCIVNTVQQVTDTPNRIAVTVNKSNYTHDMILKTGRFNVSILSEDASFEIFQHFGFQSGRDVDKFADWNNYKRAENQITYITKGTNGYLCGKVIDTMDLGTHTFFLAEVEDGDILNDTESVTYSYYHKNIKPQPKETKKTGWRCKICGYVYEGEELPPDFICPLCKHGASDFEKIES